MILHRHVNDVATQIASTTQSAADRLQPTSLALHITNNTYPQLVHRGMLECVFTTGTCSCCPTVSTTASTVDPDHPRTTCTRHQPHTLLPPLQRHSSTTPAWTCHWWHCHVHTCIHHRLVVQRDSTCVHMRHIFIHPGLSNRIAHAQPALPTHARIHVKQQWRCLTCIRA